MSERTPSVPESSRRFVVGTDVHLVPTVMLTALTVVTALLTARLFDGSAQLRPTLVLVVGVHVLALALRWSRLPPLLALPTLGLVATVFVSVVLYRSTLSGPFPTGATLDAVSADLRTVLDQFRTAVAPVPDDGAFASMTAALLALVAAVSDTLAFRAAGRVEAVVPAGVMFVLVAALANGDTDLVAVSTWLATAVLVVATLRFASGASGWIGGRSVGWPVVLPPMVAVAAVSAAVAGLVGPRLPGADAAPIVDPGGAGDSVTEVVSPLVGIGARLTRGGDRELFTVSSSDGAHYWRVMALDDFDGANWSPSAESLQRVDGSAASAMGDLAGARVDQVVTIAALGGHLVPAAHVAVAASPGSVLFAPRSESLVLPDVEVTRGDVFTIRSRVLAPTVTQLRGTTVARAPALSMYRVPDSVPESVRSAAFDATRDAPSPYVRALALQSWFRTDGGFTYDLAADYGNGPRAMADFLEQRRGFCQQFATTYAAMARVVGLPARVVVGFTPGDLDSGGTFHVFGRHAHAWPEVWFDGLGWVGFEPTPGRGSPDGVGYLPGVPAQQDDSGAIDPGQPDDPASTSTTSTTAPTDTTVDASTPRPTGLPTTTVDRATVPTSSGGSGTATGVIVATVVVGAAAVALLARRSRRRSTATSPDAAVERAWWSVCRDLRLAGAPPPAGATPLEYAQLAVEGTGVEPDPVLELARLVTIAVYGPSPVDPGAAARSGELADHVHEALGATAGRWTRWRWLQGSDAR